MEDSRFVNAMKIIQGLVGLTQDMQISESRLNVFDETPLVRDYRHIEYDLRDLVESEMRKVVSCCKLHFPLLSRFLYVNKENSLDSSKENTPIFCQYSGDCKIHTQQCTIDNPLLKLCSIFPNERFSFNL